MQFRQDGTNVGLGQHLAVRTNGIGEDVVCDEPVFMEKDQGSHKIIDPAVHLDIMNQGDHLLRMLCLKSSDKPADMFVRDGTVGSKEAVFDSNGAHDLKPLSTRNLRITECLAKLIS